MDLVPTRQNLARFRETSLGEKKTDQHRNRQNRISLPDRGTVMGGTPGCSIITCGILKDLYPAQMIARPAERVNARLQASGLSPEGGGGLGAIDLSWVSRRPSQGTPNPDWLDTAAEHAIL